MKKRGQGIQFNWIFVMISGAIFITFFAFFGLKYIDLEQAKENAKIVRTLDSAIIGSKGLSQYNTFGEDMPKFSLYYNCDSILVNKDQQLKSDHAVFIEENTESPLSMWSKEYNKPYLIDNVVFIWNSGIKFYFDPEINEEFIEELPNELKITNEDDADVLVYFGSANLKQGKKIIAFNGNIIRFVNENKEFSYNGDYIFVYGAMFSDSDSFECGKDYLEEREQAIKEIYIKKAGYFGTKCSEYGQIISALRTNNQENLEKLNEALYNHGCEVIY